jgi:AcrR family transcriptional regulator
MGRDDRRPRILDAATEVFGKYGFRQSSMELVADAAGLSRQGLYAHFASKEALFAACIEALHVRALDAGAEAARAALDAGRDGVDVIAAQLDAHTSHILERLAGSAHGAELLDESHRLCGAINAASREKHEKQLAATIQAERRAGRLPAGVPAPELARLLLHASRGIKAAVPAPSVESFRRDLGRMVRLLVAGAARDARR